MNSTPTPPSGLNANGATGKPIVRKKKPAANPLVMKKAPPRPRIAAGSAINGALKTTQKPGGLGQTLLKPLPGAVNAKAPEEAYDDYPIVTTKRALLEGLRHHVMRFLPNSSAAEVKVNPADESQFTRPVRLLRRDPHTTPKGRWGDENGDNTDGKEVDDKEREKLEALRAERRAEREANQALIAPASKAAATQKKPPKQFQKRTEQIYKLDETGERKKGMQLRYEEAIPWHLEDFDNKNIWAGSYEAALSERHIMLFPSQEPGNNTFKMVPVEKWYKFTQKNQFKALTIEEAEARMGKRVKDPRWFMDTQKVTDQQRSSGTKLFTRKGERGERRVKAEDDDEVGEVAADLDDIDYNYEEAFADDEENVLFGGDEDEIKEAEEKIKREQREANIFELKEEKDYDKEEEEKKTKEDAEKKLAKKIAKALMKREKNYIYEDDSEGNPYSSESESEDSEVERQKAEEAKKEEEKRAGDKGKSPVAAQDKTGSDVSTKGSNTPSGRPKHTDPLRKVLKRPGSPNLSEASGSESARKKKVKVNAPASGAPTPNISRPTSPANNAAVVRNPLLGKDKAGAGSEAEMSDSGVRRVKKLKVRPGNVSRPGSPGGTRASSPAPATGGGATSPLAEGAPAIQKRPAALGPPPTPEELRALIPAEGITLTATIAHFGTRTKNPGFLDLIKQNCVFDAKTKTLYPKKTLERPDTPAASTR